MKASPRNPRDTATKPLQRSVRKRPTVAGPGDDAPTLPRPRVVVHAITEDDLHPRFAGWTVACARRGKGAGPDAIGRLCLVALADGVRRLREVSLPGAGPAATGLVALRRYGEPGDACTLVDAATILWAAPVIELRQPGAAVPKRRRQRKPPRRSAAL